MSTELDAVLRRVSARTFEELAFLLPAEELTPEQKALPVENFVRVRFSGPFGGSLMLGLSDELLPLLAANMLGSDTEPDAPAQLDALKEAGNVLCGNFLPAAYGEREIFRLAAPEPVSPEEAMAGEAQAFVSLGLDEGRCEVRFSRGGGAK